MNQDRWKVVNHIFHAALEVASSERQEFVAKASGGDANLQAEVDLLLKADENAGSYIEKPLLPLNLFASIPSQLRPGDVLCGRFRIIRTIGEGGMGHVFEALDSELAVRIAIKAIRREIASNPEVLARFRQEVRLARRITHPNVCRTFDLERETRVLDSERGTTEEIVFLTMEFLEGETLAARIKREGALPLAQALDLAREIAGALGAANALGVVHRDVKPANIVLVQGQSSAHEVRAVVTDFGLARTDAVQSLGSFSTFSNKANPIGTLAYMAPEQLEGSGVSAATDIYAFGLVLFEMVTGRRAFPSDTLLSGITQRLSGAPPNPLEIVPALPECWSRAIERCLRVNPEERFASAGEVAAALDGERPVMPRALADRNETGHWLPARLTRWRTMTALLIVCAAVALFWAGLRFTRSRADSKVAAGALVYLAPVKNETGEKALNNITELLEAGLAQSAQINLLDEGRVGDTLQRMTKAPDTVIDAPIAREIAMRTGTVRVVFATVKGSAGKYLLDVDVQEPDNTPVRYRDHWKKSFAWQSAPGDEMGRPIPEELATAVRDASDWIRHEVGESANDIARLDTPPEDVTTTSWDALQDYTQSEKLAQTNQLENAVLVLDDAVKKDPGFALAWGRKGDLLLALRRDLGGYKAYDQALDAGQQSRLTRKEEDRIRGMRAVDTADYQLAVDAFHDYALNYPNDYFAWAYPERALRMLGRDEESISYLNRAVALEPRRPFAPYALADELILAGRPEEARQWMTQLRASYPEIASHIDFVLLLQDGQIDQAAQIARSLSSSSDPLERSYGYDAQASLAADRGDYRRAIEYLNRGMDEDVLASGSAQHAWKLIGRAYLESKLGGFDYCLRDVRTALDLSTSPWVIAAADTALGAAYSGAPARIRNTIRQELEHVDRLVSSSSDNGAIFDFVKLRTQGEIFLADENPKAAVDSFRRAAMKDAPAESREYMGRALAALARSETNSNKVRVLLLEALDSYSVTALRPAFIWCDPSSYLPGFFGDQLQSYLEIAKKLKIHNAVVARANVQYALLHPQLETRNAIPQVSTNE